MIDVVIPLANIGAGGSKCNNLELRFALRSIEKYLYNYNNVYIVCENSDDLTWIQNVTFLYTKNRKTKTKTILNCILKAFTVTDKMFFMNDDMYFLNSINAETFPYYYSDKAQQEIVDRPDFDLYKRIMLDTNVALNKIGIEQFNYFDIHCPIIYEKEKFRNVITNVNWNSQKYGYLIKSLYGNLNVKNAIETDDNVATTKDSKFDIFKSFFSVGHNFPEEELKKLAILYPKKSIFEK